MSETLLSQITAANIKESSVVEEMVHCFIAIIAMKIFMNKNSRTYRIISESEVAFFFFLIVIEYIINKATPLRR
jgi:hypothetical protein